MTHEIASSVIVTITRTETRYETEIKRTTHKLFLGAEIVSSRISRTSILHYGKNADRAVVAAAQACEPEALFVLHLTPRA